MTPKCLPECLRFSVTPEANPESLRGVQGYRVFYLKLQ